MAGGSRSWYKGALGEIAIGHLLTALGPDWTVLHAVPVGAKTADIYHVLIGPSGVFTINTKNHSGQSVWVAGHVMMVAGRKQRHLQNARYEATRTAGLLGR
ncbi:nuclease-related domain-containing protein [Paenarthrobacter sp. CAP02]|uniref:nuclease-related domain-containing protein n=1 Tax=Paenarthrobacter sp. CAP02 TaxID=3158144 RepID=UPI0032DBEB18